MGRPFLLVNLEAHSYIIKDNYMLNSKLNINDYLKFTFYYNLIING